MNINEAVERMGRTVTNACREIDRLRDDKRTLIVALRKALPVLYLSGSDEEAEIAEAALAAAERK
jgi:hypothetical protein